MTFARHALCRHWCIWRAGGSYRTSLGSTWCHLAETKGPLHTGWPASYIAAMMVALVVRSKVQAVEWKCWIWMTQVNLGQILRIINYILRLWTMMMMVMMMLLVMVVTTTSCHGPSLKQPSLPWQNCSGCVHSEGMVPNYTQGFIPQIAGVMNRTLFPIRNIEDVITLCAYN